MTGDLGFSKDSFNDVAALILALLSYLLLKDIVPGFESNKEISPNDTAKHYFSKFSTAENKSFNINTTASSSFNAQLEGLLKEAGSCS